MLKGTSVTLLAIREHFIKLLPEMKLIHGSLFSGIGGFEKGAELAGIETIWNCEYEKHNRERLKKHWPGTQQFHDVRTMSNPGYVDIISGGFPCQDISVAGSMEGIRGGAIRIVE